MTQKLFVTGATGVLGRAVVPRLVEAGHRVAAVARTPEKATWLAAQGAHAVEVDLMDVDHVADVVAGQDAVLHLATHIPTGAGAATRRGWRANDVLRRDVSRILADAVIAAGVPRYVGESITFTYEDRAGEWIDESVPLATSDVNETVLDAESAATRVTGAGGAGVSLRFAMFWATDSPHIETYRAAARRGVFAVVGPPQAYVSFVHIDDAATAVLAALDAPAGVYNVAEPDPRPRADHLETMARAVGRTSLRPLPAVLVGLGGSMLESLTRSQRVTSGLLAERTSWEPHQRVVDWWDRS